MDAIPITVSDGALAHLKRMRQDKGNTALLLRVGVRSGGCSGLSYAMDFEEPEKVSEEDAGANISTQLCRALICNGHNWSVLILDKFTAS